MSSNAVATFTDDNFESEVLGSDQPVLVDFWAPWCGPCRAIAPTIDAVAEATVGSAKVGKVNVDENQDLARRLGVLSIPALLFFADGKERDRLVGMTPERELRDRLSALSQPTS